MTLYDDLDIDKDATQTDIKKAFYNKAKTEHPDKGGTEERFQIVQHAYSILKDEKKRSFYDSTGQEQKQMPFNTKFSLFVQQYLLQIIFQAQSVEHQDIADGFIRIANKCIQEVNQTIEKLKGDKDAIERIEEVLKRLKAKDKAKDLLNLTLEQEIDMRTTKHNADITHWNTELEFFTKAKEYLDNYTYDFTKQPKVKMQKREWTVLDPEITIEAFFGSRMP